MRIYRGRRRRVKENMTWPSHLPACPSAHSFKTLPYIQGWWCPRWQLWDEDSPLLFVDLKAQWEFGWYVQASHMLEASPRFNHDSAASFFSSLSHLWVTAAISDPFMGAGGLRIAALSVVKGRNRTGCITLEVAHTHTREMLQFGTATEKSEEEEGRAFSWSWFMAIN